MALCERCRIRSPHKGLLCSRCSKAVPKGATAPCKRCGEPYERKQGWRFCTDCTGVRATPRRLESQLAADAECLTRAAERKTPMTDDEIALALGITRQRVNMIVQSALAKLRTAIGDREAWR